MPASLARAHTGLKCMHMHMHCYCVCRRRRPGPPPYRLPPRPADRVGHRPGHACKKWTDAPTRSCMPRAPGPAAGAGGSELSDDTARASAHTHACCLRIYRDACLDRRPCPAARHGLHASLCMHVLLVPCLAACRLLVYMMHACKRWYAPHTASSDDIPVLLARLRHPSNQTLQ